MRHFDYQRTVIAYHGCDESVVRRVLLTGDHLSASENDYDWLGYGIYFSGSSGLSVHWNGP